MRLCLHSALVPEEEQSLRFAGRTPLRTDQALLVRVSKSQRKGRKLQGRQSSLHQIFHYFHCNNIPLRLLCLLCASFQLSPNSAKRNLRFWYDASLRLQSFYRDARTAMAEAAVNTETDLSSNADSQPVPGAFSTPSEPSAPPSPTRAAPPPPWVETFTRAMAETGGPIGIANVRPLLVFIRPSGCRWKGDVANYILS